MFESGRRPQPWTHPSAEAEPASLGLVKVSELLVFLRPADAAQVDAGSVRCSNSAHIVPPLKAERHSDLAARTDW